MGNTKSLPAFILERVISSEITIGICNNSKQGLRYNDVMYYYKNIIEHKNKLMYQFENDETDQVFLILEKCEDNVSYVLEINNYKNLGYINETIKKFSKRIDYQSEELDKIFDFIKN